MPGCGICRGAFISRPVHLAFQLPVLLPLRIDNLLIGSQQGIDLAVGVLADRTAGLVVGSFVTGGICTEAIQRDVETKEDHSKFDHLILIEIELLLQSGELTGCALSWGERCFCGGGIYGIGGGVGGL